MPRICKIKLSFLRKFYCAYFSLNWNDVKTKSTDLTNINQKFLINIILG